MNASHEFWTDKLSAWLDGDLSDREAEAVEGHLEVCEACRLVESELAEVRRQARALGSSEPEADLWPLIAADLGRDPLADEVIDLTLHLEGVRPMSPVSARREGVFLGFPQAIAAMLVLVFGGWGLGAVMTESDPAPGLTVSPQNLAFTQASQILGTPEISDRLNELESRVSQRRGELSPGVLEVLERNLALIDRAIEESLAALAEAPEADYMRGQLESALLRREAVLTSTVRTLDRGD